MIFCLRLCAQSGGRNRETCADHGRAAPMTTLYPLFVPRAWFWCFCSCLETTNWELENSLLEWVGGRGGCGYFRRIMTIFRVEPLPNVFHGVEVMNDGKRQALGRMLICFGLRADITLMLFSSIFLFFLSFFIALFWEGSYPLLFRERSEMSILCSVGVVWWQWVNQWGGRRIDSPSGERLCRRVSHPKKLTFNFLGFHAISFRSFPYRFFYVFRYRPSICLILFVVSPLSGSRFASFCLLHLRGIFIPLLLILVVHVFCKWSSLISILGCLIMYPTGCQ